MPAIPGYKTASGPTLPPSAPKIRATAGLGTSGQKTWNLRRPVTVIGSGRSASITLSGKAVAKAHCAIINTGSTVLLKNFCEPHATLCNGQPVDLTPLADGDVIQVDAIRIQLALQFGRRTNEQTGTGMTYCDPVRAMHPITVQRADQPGEWHIEDTVAVIGRRPGLPLHVNDEQVSLAHAMLFEFERRPVLCDLGSRTGVTINGEPQTLAFLDPGDRFRVGRAEFVLADVAADPSRPEANDNGKTADLRQWEDELRTRERRLDAREAAVESRMKELGEYEDALRRREAQLGPPGPPTERGEPQRPEPAVQFRDVALSTESFAADSDSARQAIDRAWRILHRAGQRPNAGSANRPAVPPTTSNS